MELQEFYDYKDRLMADLCTNPAIVDIVTGKQNAEVPNRSLPYTQIFPFEYVPDTIDDAKTFICFDVDITKVSNKTFYVPVIYIWVFTHKSKMRLDTGGVLVDRLSTEIDKMLNGSRFYGLGELELYSVGRFTPTDDYKGRVMAYITRDFNRSAPKPIPANRKHPNGV